MRKLFLLSALISLLGWTELRAQAQRGTTYWGGTVRLDGRLSHTKDLDKNSKSGFTENRITPEIQWGKFINPTTMIGLGIVYDLTWTRQISPVASGTGAEMKSRGVYQSADVLPFLRKYKFVNEHWAVFLHGQTGKSFGVKAFKWDNLSREDRKENYTYYRLEIKSGLVYTFPGKQLSIEGYFNLLSLSALYKPLIEEANQPRKFTFSTGLSTSFPRLIQIRMAKNINVRTTQP